MRLGIGATSGMRPKFLRMRFLPVNDLAMDAPHQYRLPAVLKTAPNSVLIHQLNLRDANGRQARALPRPGSRWPPQRRRLKRSSAPCGKAANGYLTSTVAPASSSCFLILAA